MPVFERALNKCSRTNCKILVVLLGPCIFYTKGHKRNCKDAPYDLVSLGFSERVEKTEIC